jgi:hypothetical protein
MEEMVNAFNILVGKPEGRRPRRTWEDNIKLDIRIRGCVAYWINWIDISGGLL